MKYIKKTSKCCDQEPYIGTNYSEFNERLSKLAFTMTIILPLENLNSNSRLKFDTLGMHRFPFSASVDKTLINRSSNSGEI